jgi:hypothetical protein
MGCYIEAKSDLSIPGLSYFQRQHFLSRLSEFELVNDGSDSGRAGMKQLKDSLWPIRMHIQYSGHQQPRLLMRVLKGGLQRFGAGARAKLLSPRKLRAPPNTGSM